MIEIVKIVKVEKLGGHRLRLRFPTARRASATSLTSSGGRAHGRAAEGCGMFDRVFIEFGTLTWPNGFDLDSIALHDEMRAAGLLRQMTA